MYRTQVDHYLVLGIPSGEQGSKLTVQEITTAYKKKSLELHPDKCPNDPNAKANFQNLNSSYQILKDERTRNLFDQRLSMHLKRRREEKQRRKHFKEQRRREEQCRRRRKLFEEQLRREEHCRSRKVYGHEEELLRREEEKLRRLTRYESEMVLEEDQRERKRSMRYLVRRVRPHSNLTSLLATSASVRIGTTRKNENK